MSEFQPTLWSELPLPENLQQEEIEALVAGLKQIFSNKNFHNLYPEPFKENSGNLLSFSLSSFLISGGPNSTPIGTSGISLLVATAHATGRFGREDIEILYTQKPTDGSTEKLHLYTRPENSTQATSVILAKRNGVWEVGSAEVTDYALSQTMPTDINFAKRDAQIDEIMRNFIRSKEVVDLGVLNKEKIDDAIKQRMEASLAISVAGNYGEYNEGNILEWHASLPSVQELRTAMANQKVQRILADMQKEGLISSEDTIGTNLELLARIVADYVQVEADWVEGKIGPRTLAQASEELRIAEERYLATDLPSPEEMPHLSAATRRKLDIIHAIRRGFGLSQE